MAKQTLLQPSTIKGLFAKHEKASQAAEISAVDLAKGKELVGRKLVALNTGDGNWYEAVIVKFRASDSYHQIKYDEDGVTEWVRFESTDKTLKFLL